MVVIFVLFPLINIRLYLSMVKAVNDKINGLSQSDEFKNLMGFITGTLASELPTLVIDSDYFLLGVLMQKNNLLYKRLDSCMTSSSLTDIFNTWYSVVSSKALSAVKGNRVPKFDDKLSKYIGSAAREATGCGSNEVTSEHVFLSILSDDDDSNKIRKVFNKAGISYMFFKKRVTEGSVQDNRQTVLLVGGDADMAKKIMGEMSNMNGMAQMAMNGFPGQQKIGKKNGKTPYMDEFCEDLNSMAEKGRLTPVIGLDGEISRVIRVMARRKKNNALVIGMEGVGKTCLVEAIAQRIVDGNVPDFMQGKHVMKLNMTSLMAGTIMRGMLEERVNGIIEEFRKNQDRILFIDNIGSVLSGGGHNDYDMAQMFSSALENGDIQVIGTCTYKSYRQAFEKNQSLARKFQNVVIEGPSKEEAISILNGVKGWYEDFHSVRYTEESVMACVCMADRYIKERMLPDSAIDLMDEVGAAKGKAGINPETVKLAKEVHESERTVEKLKAEKKFEEADEERKHFVELKQKYNETVGTSANNRIKNPIEITESDVAEMVSEKTGIPAANITPDSRERLVSMADRIKESVIGQDNAIDTVCTALKRKYIGLGNGGCMYSCMCIGRSGVGKTLLAKTLAKELFGSTDDVIRLDMSEYSDSVSVNKLIGSNPGYVGYEEGGVLTEAAKRKKHAILLVDEIEKADPQVYNVFLQILDEGFLTDNSGMKVDFSNIIVIFTSNVGTKEAADFSSGVGFITDKSSNEKRILTKEMKDRFKPEFLNRIDDIIYFRQLSDDDMEKIISIEIGKLCNTVSDLGYGLECSKGVYDRIFDMVRNEEHGEYGARPVVRTVRSEIGDALTDRLLSGEYEKGYVFKASCSPKSDKIIVR